MARLKFVFLPAVALLYLLTSIMSPLHMASGTLREERAASRQLLDNLDTREKKLSLELAALDLKIFLGRKKLSEIENIIKEVSLEKEAALLDSQLARASAEKSLKKIHSWLNIRYRYGYTSYVNLLLNSENFFDFLNRSYFLTTLIAREKEVYKDVTRELDIALEKEQLLDKTRERLARQEKMLLEQTLEIEKAAAEREVMLAKVLLESAELSGTLAGIEKNLLNSLNLLGFAVRALESIKWSSVAPEKIYFVAGGLSVKISQSAINNAFSSSGDKNLQDMALTFNPDGMSIEIKGTQNSPSLLLKGQLKASTGANIIFSPGSLILDGLPLGSEVFKELSPQISIPVSQLPLMENHIIKNVTTYDGGVTVLLTAIP